MLNQAAILQQVLAAKKAPPYHAPEQVLCGPRMTTLADEDQFHPSTVSLTALLDPMSSTARKAALQPWVAWMLDRKLSAETALTAIGVRTDLPSTLPLALVPAADWPFTVKKRADLSYRLGAGRRSSKQSGAGSETTDTNLALECVTAADAVTTTAATSGVKAAALLLQLRCLADVYGRWDAAANVARDLLPAQLTTPALTGKELLARALTLHRIEGDGNLPPEDDTLDPAAGGVPLPPGRSRADVALMPERPATYWLTCLFTQPGIATATAVTESLYVTLDPAARAATDALRRACDLYVSTMVCAFDIYYVPDMQTNAEIMGPASPPLPPAGSRDFFDWAALNRLAGGQTYAEGRLAAEQAWTHRVGLLTSRTKGKDRTGADVVRVAPVAASTLGPGWTGPPPAVELVRQHLGEAMRYLDRLTFGPQRFGSGAPGRLPEILCYLLYHQGHQSAAVLASAAAASLTGTSPWARALAKALKAAGLDATTRAVIVSVRKDDNETAVARALSHWSSNLAPLFRQQPVLTALADYLRHEGTAEWKAWADTKVRPNVVSYAQVHEFLLAQVTS